MKLGVRVLPKPEVLDVQGRAVENVLQSNGFQLNGCRVGKWIELEVPGENKDQALANVRAMADHILYNPLTEVYEVEVL